MSPTRTLISWGSSSILNQRRIWPTRVTRGSRLVVRREPILWAPDTMLRNLKMRKERPFNPTRTWRKKTGPWLSILISAATTRRNGSRMTRPTVAMTRSTALFSIEVSTAVGADDGAQSLADAIHVVLGQAGEQGERDDALPFRRGARQILGAGAEHVAVVAVLVQRDEVDAGADAGRGEPMNDLVAADAQLLFAYAHDEQVPGMLDVRPAGRQLDRRDVRERGAVLRHDAPPLSLHGGQALELDQPERRVEVGHVVLEAGITDVVTPGAVLAVALPRVAVHAVQAPRRDALAERGVARGHHAAFPSGQVLRGVEAENGQVTERADQAAAVARRQRVRRVLHHRHVVLARQ